MDERFDGMPPGALPVRRSGKRPVARTRSATCRTPAACFAAEMLRARAAAELHLTGFNDKFADLVLETYLEVKHREEKASKPHEYLAPRDLIKTKQGPPKPPSSPPSPSSLLFSSMADTVVDHWNRLGVAEENRCHLDECVVMLRIAKLLPAMKPAEDKPKKSFGPQEKSTKFHLRYPTNPTETPCQDVNASPLTDPSQEDMPATPHKVERGTEFHIQEKDRDVDILRLDDEPSTEEDEEEETPAPSPVDDRHYNSRATSPTDLEEEEEAANRVTPLRDAEPPNDDDDDGDSLPVVIGHGCQKLFRRKSHDRNNNRRSSPLPPIARGLPPPAAEQLRAPPPAHPTLKRINLLLPCSPPHLKAKVMCRRGPSVAAERGEPGRKDTHPRLSPDNTGSAARRPQQRGSSSRQQVDRSLAASARQTSSSCSSSGRKKAGDMKLVRATQVDLTCESRHGDHIKLYEQPMRSPSPIINASNSRLLLPPIKPKGRSPAQPSGKSSSEQFPMVVECSDSQYSPLPPIVGRPLALKPSPPSAPKPTVTSSALRRKRFKTAKPD